MSKGKRLNTAEIAKIEVLRKIGFSNCHIAREIGRSEGVIRNFFKKGQKYGIKKKTKGNTNLSAVLKGRIREEGTSNCLNSRQIMDKLELSVTKQHVAYILRNMPGIKWKKMQGKPR